MNFLSDFLPVSNMVETKYFSRLTLYKIFYYGICTILGMLAGVMGVALTLALAISVQLLFFPLATFWPDVFAFSVLAVFFTAGFSWLLHKLVSLFLPVPFQQLTGIKIILLSGIFINILETFLFFPMSM